MKYVILLAISFLQWRFGLTADEKNTSPLLSLTQELKSAAVAAVEAINDNVISLSTILNPDCVEVPPTCPNHNITFWLYTNDNARHPVQLIANQRKTLNIQNVEKSNPWKIIIHGYTKSKDEIPNPELRSAYFKKGQFNLISVDYSPISRDKCYVASVKNVPVIAKCTAQLIEALMQRGYFELRDLHVIGFSLGAQIAGQIYEYLHSGKPGRVTGLDPASPLFDGKINHKVTENSGDFVDIIHTNALGKGKLEPTGHIDFYLNGGTLQPGCLTSNNGSISTCNHDRSPIYFAESINSEKGFWGIPCNSYAKFISGDCDTEERNLVIMGDRTPSTKRGVYHLQTFDKPPFALGKLSRALNPYK